MILHAMADSAADAPAPDAPEDENGQGGAGPGEPSAGRARADASAGGELADLVDRLEARVRSLLDETGRSALDQGRRKIEENPVTAVLLALGLGLLLGLLLGRRRG